MMMHAYKEGVIEETTDGGGGRQQYYKDVYKNWVAVVSDRKKPTKQRLSSISGLVAYVGSELFVSAVGGGEKDQDEAGGAGEGRHDVRQRLLNVVKVSGCCCRCFTASRESIWASKKDSFWVLK